MKLFKCYYCNIKQNKLNMFPLCTKCVNINYYCKNCENKHNMTCPIHCKSNTSQKENITKNYMVSEISDKFSEDIHKSQSQQCETCKKKIGYVMSSDYEEVRSKSRYKKAGKIAMMLNIAITLGSKS